MEKKERHTKRQILFTPLSLYLTFGQAVDSNCFDAHLVIHFPRHMSFLWKTAWMPFPSLSFSPWPHLFLPTLCFPVSFFIGLLKYGPLIDMNVLFRKCLGLYYVYLQYVSSSLLATWLDSHLNIWNEVESSLLTVFSYLLYLLSYILAQIYTVSYKIFCSEITLHKFYPLSKGYLKSM